MHKKINWIQKGDVEITSVFHGQTWQGGQAQDFRAKPLFAPEKLRIRRKVVAGYNSLVELELTQSIGSVFYQIVHFESDKPQGYIFQKGEEIKGKDTSGNNHFHIALNVVGVWQKVLAFTAQNRNIKIVNNRWIGKGGWSTFDFEKWSFYDEKGDLAIQFKDPTPTPPKPKPPAPKPLRTYKVKSGDFLNKIAKEQLGNSSRYLEIYNLNKNIIGPNPSKIKAGQILKLPN
jgi:LysM repeat protein